jgi:hypothetical protein
MTIPDTAFRYIPELRGKLIQPEDSKMRHKSCSQLQAGAPVRLFRQRNERQFLYREW